MTVVAAGCCAFVVLSGTDASAADDELIATGLDVGAAAASAAADAAGVALGDSAERAARAAATVATSALPPAKIPARLKASAPSHGWASGASGVEAENGSFAGFRGEPLGVVAVWSDTTEEAQTQMDSVDNYSGFNGEMDVAVGGLVRGETWEQAASGAFVERWTTAIRNIKAKRAGKGTTYIRIAHEFNGDWMAWGITKPSELAAYKAGYRLYAGIVRKEFPQAKLTWSPNGGNHNTMTTDQMYPGSDVVDVIGPDDYDGYPNYTSAALWKENVNVWTNSSTPKGLGAWAQYAARKGKPLAVPEWGVQNGDHPAYIQGVHDFMAAHAARKGGPCAGKVIYDAYFNAEDKFKLTDGSKPESAQLYAELTWGN